MRKKQTPHYRRKPVRLAKIMTEAEIDETLAGSFPASDPPSWTLGTDRGAATDMNKNKLNQTKRPAAANAP